MCRICWPSWACRAEPRRLSTRSNWPRATAAAPGSPSSSLHRQQLASQPLELGGPVLRLVHGHQDELAEAPADEGFEQTADAGQADGDQAGWIDARPAGGQGRED